MFTPISLSQRLASLPGKTNFAVPSPLFDPEAFVLRLLYFACCGEGRYFDHLFPGLNLPSDSFPKSYDDVYETAYAFYDQQKPSDNFSHKGRICAIEIPQGEPVYNCYDCGVDPTCCMCDHCFNKEEHSDHNVSMHISQGNAICDCGDPASWKVDLKCLANMKAEADEFVPELPEGFRLAIENAISSALDYFLDVQSLFVETVPSVHHFLKGVTNIKDIENLSKLLQLPEEKYGALKKFETFYLVVWNDEFHNWDSAISSLAAGCEAMGETTQQCVEMASDIDTFGYTRMFSGYDIEALNTAAKKVGASGLTVTVVSDEEIARNYASTSCIKFLSRIVRSANIRVAEYSKKVIADLLLERYTVDVPNIPSSYQSFANAEMGLLVDNKIPSNDEGVLDNSGMKELDQLMQLHGGWFPTKKSKKKSFVEFTRLQLLFFMEMRYPKSTRNLLKTFLIPIITNSFRYRMEFARQIVDVLPQLEHFNQLEDREWNLSLLDSFRLQVYHDPSIGTILLKEGRLVKVMRSLLNILRIKSSAYSRCRYIAPVGRSNSTWIDRRRYSTESQALKGFETILSFIDLGSDEIFKFDQFIYLLAIVSHFQSCREITRKLGDHVVMEDLSYKLPYTRATTVYDITRNVGRLVAGLAERNQKVEDTISLVSSYLEVEYSVVSRNVAIYPVSESLVGFIHPLHSLLAEMCMFYRFFDLSMLDFKGNVIRFPAGELTLDKDLIPDKQSYAQHGTVNTILQSLVLSSQIDTGFWVRNGNGVHAQAWINRTFFNPDGDLYIVQLAVLLHELEVTEIFRIWEFLDCIQGSLAFEESVYQDKASPMLLEMATMFYRLLTYRLPFDSTLSRDDVEYLRTKAEICYSLLREPKMYSTLKRQFEGEPFFDKAFEDVSTFIPPRGIKDYGKYALKDEVYSELDPMDVLNKYEASDDVQEAIFEKMASLKNKKPEDIVLKPHFHLLSEEDLAKTEPIAELLKSQPFVKYLYKSLRLAADTDADDHLMATLHLIHAIIVDDSMRYSDDNNHLQSVIDIPICNMLLYIVEKEDSSKNAAKKAASILDALLLKDDAVLQSLTDCFGETHIEEYRKSKHGQTLETKKERVRRLALKRQQKILARMRGQQQEFLDKNKSFFEKMKTEQAEASATEKKVDSETTPRDEPRVCILCRNSENYEELFGVPALISKSSVFWNIPVCTRLSGPDFMVPGMNEASKDSENSRPKAAIKYYEPGLTKTKHVVSGCPHGMHFSCFENMIREKAYKYTSFICPLCQNYCNAFVPSFPFPHVQMDPTGEMVADHWMEIEKETEGDNCSQLTSQVFDSNLLHVLSNSDSPVYRKMIRQLEKLREKTKVLEVSDDRFPEPDVFRGISNLIASTLEMCEIASRQNGDTEPVTPLTMMLLRSLVQYRVLLNYLPTISRKETSELPVTPGEGDGKKDDFFFLGSILSLYLSGNEYFQTLIDHSLYRWLSITAMSMMFRYSESPENVEMDSILVETKLESNSLVFEILSKLCHGASISLGFSGSILPELLNKVYKVLASIYLRYQSQVELLAECFHFTSTSFLKSLDDLILSTQEGGLGFEMLQFECAHAQEVMEPYTMSLDYPAPVHLKPMPAKMADFLSILKPETVPISGKRATGRCICLLCGKVVANKNFHHNECTMGGDNYGLYFSPYNNSLIMNVQYDSKLFDEGGSDGFYTKLSSPYLNRHGEPAGGLIGAGESGILDPKRYEYLNQCWLDQSMATSAYREWCSRIRSGRGRMGPIGNVFEMGEDPVMAATANAMAAAMNGMDPFVMDPDDEVMDMDLEDDEEDEDDEDGI
ncbi:DEKNAAC105338 [Brettanomyces naardenensis]|uniref:E3 ubiquitin-protein ligase n=1 Tax=Brettanomyces naardenensis TaxID=13370 RepID=A0A448YTL3_BRENA|nr:DEKNAAC105338 [Brettanomyces naardenensis]